MIKFKVFPLEFHRIMNNCVPGIKLLREGISINCIELRNRSILK